MIQMVIRRRRPWDTYIPDAQSPRRSITSRSTGARFHCELTVFVLLCSVINIAPEPRKIARSITEGNYLIPPGIPRPTYTHAQSPIHYRSGHYSLAPVSLDSIELLLLSSDRRLTSHAIISNEGRRGRKLLLEIQLRCPRGSVVMIMVFDRLSRIHMRMHGSLATSSFLPHKYPRLVESLW